MQQSHSLHAHTNVSLSRNSRLFMEAEGSLSSSQEPVYSSTKIK
jgi:hypothetical protein